MIRKNPEPMKPGSVVQFVQAASWGKGSRKWKFRVQWHWSQHARPRVVERSSGLTLSCGCSCSCRAGVPWPWQ